MAWWCFWVQWFLESGTLFTRSSPSTPRQRCLTASWRVWNFPSRLTSSLINIRRSPRRWWPGWTEASRPWTELACTQGRQKKCCSAWCQKKRSSHWGRLWQNLTKELLSSSRMSGRCLERALSNINIKDFKNCAKFCVFGPEKKTIYRLAK